MPLQTEPVSLSFLCNSVELMLQPHLKPAVDFAVDLMAPEDITFLTDRTRLLQVLTNLLGNAMKFTARGSVKLLVTLDDKRIYFKVRSPRIFLLPKRMT